MDWGPWLVISSAVVSIGCVVCRMLRIPDWHLHVTRSTPNLVLTNRSFEKGRAVDISSADIKLILTALQDAGFDQADVVVGDVHIAVARGGAQLTSPAPATTAASASLATPISLASTKDAPEVTSGLDGPTSENCHRAADSQHVVTSPSVGVFRHAAQAGDAPFVEVGRKVSAGDTLGIVEVSRLTMPVEAQAEGVVTAIAIDDAGVVEYGTPLVTIAS